MEFLIFILLISAALLLVDVCYSIRYFEYTYLLELKRRFGVIGKGLPFEYRQQLRNEIQKEMGSFRVRVQSFYVPWFLLCFVANLWYLPIIVTGLIAITNNLFYRKPYISPFMLLLNLVVMACCYGYTLVTLGMLYYK